MRETKADVQGDTNYSAVKFSQSRNLGVDYDLELEN
jgi:hypothetical protein